MSDGLIEVGRCEVIAQETLVLLFLLLFLFLSLIYLSLFARADYHSHWIFGNGKFGTWAFCFGHPIWRGLLTWTNATWLGYIEGRLEYHCMIFVPTSAHPKLEEHCGT
jgi:hypothetical protein